MKIILSPQASSTTDLPPTVTSDTITYRGIDYDLSQLLEGATVEGDSPFIGKLYRSNGEINLTLEFNYDMNLAEDSQSSNLDDYTFIVTDGQCPNPIVYKPITEPVDPLEGDNQ